MRLVLDTHALLWCGLSAVRLSATARARITDPANQIEISPASDWEIAIKIGLGKYALTQPFRPFFEHVLAANQMTILPITLAHAEAIAGLPRHHNDRFDRLIIAQTIVEGTPVVS